MTNEQTHTNTEALSDLLPCPFCGSDGKMIRPMGERLYNKDEFGKTVPPYYGEDWFRVVCGADDCFCSARAFAIESDAITAWNRRSASNAGGVEVKALEWSEENEAFSRATSIAGVYTISFYDGMDRPYKLDLPWQIQRKHFGTLPEAKAAAQADFNARILSAISLAAEAEPVAQGSCASCNGTGDTGGNPSYGMCPDCDGTGKFPPAHPSTPVSAEVTENMALVPRVETDAMCEDCPPPDYPTDDTRCLPCPRRAALKAGA